MYQWIERAFISDDARFQKGGPPPLRLFDGLSRRQTAAMLVTPPIYCPIRCGLSYGVWYEFPETGEATNAEIHRQATT